MSHTKYLFELSLLTNMDLHQRLKELEAELTHHKIRIDILSHTIEYIETILSNRWANKDLNKDK